MPTSSLATTSANFAGLGAALAVVCVLCAVLAVSAVISGLRAQQATGEDRARLRRQALVLGLLPVVLVITFVALVLRG